MKEQVLAYASASVRIEICVVAAKWYHREALGLHAKMACYDKHLSGLYYRWVFGIDPIARAYSKWYTKNAAFIK